MIKEEFKRKGGSWLGAARSWIQRHCIHGDTVTWGSATELRPAITVAKVEDIAGDAAFAIYRKQRERVEVYSIIASYPFRVEDGSMVEKSLHLDYCAEDELSAVKAGVEWAQNRLEEYIKDTYKESFLGCVKISGKSIGKIGENGRSTTTVGMTFFEWKYDYPDTLEERVGSFERIMTA